jgi:HPt (histidine-containing phosphotransfer) domain-containing protein
MDFERSTMDPVLDVRGALARLDGDDDLLVDLLRFFLEDSTRLQEQLAAAVSAGDAQEARVTAHAIKGLVAGCGGVRAAEAAKRVEHGGQAGDLAGLPALVEALAAELDAVRGEARGYLG